MLDLQFPILIGAVAVTLTAGFVKGALGFAMPLIMISGLASLLPAHTALAALILPAVVTNLFQAFRHGIGPAIDVLRNWWRLILTICIFIVIAAEVLPEIPQKTLLIALGIPVTLFAISQLLGWQLRFHARHRALAEVLCGAVAGFYGGLSGIWGPPTLALLVSTNTGKRDSYLVQGVVYLIGAVMLLVAHLHSGILNATTLPLSAALVVPALVGMAAGFAVHTRLDAARFRRWTLVILVIVGLNLIRRALTL